MVQWFGDDRRASEIIPVSAPRVATLSDWIPRRAGAGPSVAGRVAPLASARRRAAAAGGIGLLAAVPRRVPVG